MQPDKTVLYVALLASFFNLLGILYNHHLSKKLKTSDKDDEEKRELRRKIHDRLAEFENDALPKLLYIKKVADRLTYLARNVRRYDVSLSSMIKIFRSDWEKTAASLSEKSSSIQKQSYKGYTPKHVYKNYFKKLADIIGERADNLLVSPSVFDKIKVWRSWLRFRIGLAKKNWQQKKFGK